MFHDMGLTYQHDSVQERFEVDGANAAVTFYVATASPGRTFDTVSAAIALHTTPGIPQHMHPPTAG
jgi:hypothetical protein